MISTLILLLYFSVKYIFAPCGPVLNSSPQVVAELGS